MDAKVARVILMNFAEKILPTLTDDDFENSELIKVAQRLHAEGLERNWDLETGKKIQEDE